MEIKLASLSDIPELCELLGVLFAQEAEFAPDRATQRRGLEQILGRPGTGHILVVRNDMRIIAMVSLLYTISTALGARVALLEDMVVAPEVRRNGVGSRLLEHAVRFARSQGCKRITLLTDRDNAEAQRFYERHGFAVSSMIPLRLLLR